LVTPSLLRFGKSLPRKPYTISVNVNLISVVVLRANKSDYYIIYYKNCTTHVPRADETNNRAENGKQIFKRLQAINICTCSLSALCLAISLVTAILCSIR